MLMLDFETFCNIFYFFVRCEMDASYVNTVDSGLGLEETGAIELVEQVKNFHRMRSVLCQDIMRHLNRTPMTGKLLDSFCRASGVEQYGSAPPGSTCVLTGLELNPQNGCLLVVDHQMSYTIDKRFKTAVFNLWYLVHLPQELTLEVFKWLRTQHHWNHGKTDIPTAVGQIRNYEDNNFAKRAYIKLTKVCKYIQSDMPDVAINSQHKVNK